MYFYRIHVPDCYYFHQVHVYNGYYTTLWSTFLTVKISRTSPIIILFKKKKTDHKKLSRIKRKINYIVTATKKTFENMTITIIIIVYNNNCECAQIIVIIIIGDSTVLHTMITIIFLLHQLWLIFSFSMNHAIQAIR